MSTVRFRAVLAAVLLLAFHLAMSLDTASAQARRTALKPAPAPQLLKRDVLGLYDGTTEPAAKGTRLHKYLEMPLNHLGYRLTLHDISKGLPPLDAIARYHAVATWFSGEISEGRSFLLWAARAARSGTRFVVLDSVGLLGEKSELPVINAFLRELGLAYADYFVSDAKDTRVLAADAMIGFEAKLEASKLPGHQVVIARNSKLDVHLSLTDPAHRWAGARYSAQVSTSPRGGFASTGYVMEYDATANVTRWIIDPFAFLEASLGSEPRPIPDTTTISGRRIYFSHIDGDGWNNISSVAPNAERRDIAAAVMLDRLIAPYPDLPVTVGLIAGDADPTHGGTAQAAEVARRIFALPHVETASHTCTHPYHWAFYATYKRDAEIARVLRFADDQPAYDDRNLATLVRHWRAQNAAKPAASEDDASVGLPRARPQQPFDLDLEVKGALDRTARLAPASKPPSLYLWSGDTTPFEAAIKATRDSGVRNMNGGDSRLDAKYPSVAYVPPVGIAVGAERQIYAVNSNENTYTDGWKGPYDAFKQLSETLDNTERPRRLKAFNLYYHSFSATRPEGLDAVKTHLDRARRDHVTPIKASRYAAIADSFYTTEIVPAGTRRWRITNRGALDTVRFDRADAIEVDDRQSVGVVGYTHYLGSLYVALDAAVREPVVAIAAADPRRQRRPHLVESRWLLSNLEHQPCRSSATVEGYGDGGFTWEGFSPGAYTITAARGTQTVHKVSAAADATGRLAFSISADAIEPLTLAITCASIASPHHGSQPKPSIRGKKQISAPMR